MTDTECAACICTVHIYPKKNGRSPRHDTHDTAMRIVGEQREIIQWSQLYELRLDDVGGQWAATKHNVRSMHAQRATVEKDREMESKMEREKERMSMLFALGFHVCHPGVFVYRKINTYFGPIR